MGSTLLIGESSASFINIVDVYTLLTSGYNTPTKAKAFGPYKTLDRNRHDDDVTGITRWKQCIQRVVAIESEFQDARKVLDHASLWS